MIWQSHYDIRPRYKYGTFHGMLGKANIDLVEADLILRSQKMGATKPTSVLYNLISSILQNMEDGLVFLLLFYFIECLFVSVIWFLIASIPFLHTQLVTINFGSAFYAITFLISIIMGDRFRKSIGQSSAASRRYLDILVSIRGLALQTSIIFKKSFHVHLDAVTNQLVIHPNTNFSNQQDRLREAEIHRRNLSRILCTLAYYIYACMGDHGLCIDSNYFHFKIYNGEKMIYKNKNWKKTFENVILGENKSCLVDTVIKQELLLSYLKNDEWKLRSGSSSGEKGGRNSDLRVFTIIRRMSGPEDMVTDGHDMHQQHHPYIEDLHAKHLRLKQLMRGYFTRSELDIIKYHLDVVPRRNGTSPRIDTIRHDRYGFTMSILAHISDILEEPAYQLSNMNNVIESLVNVSDKITDVWVDQQTGRPPIYEAVFLVILFIYVIFAVPLQVIGNTNEYWGIIITTIIIMIYITPLVISDWIGLPFSKNKETLHPPHRQQRADLCEDIMEHFGYSIEAIYAPARGKTSY